MAARDRHEPDTAGCPGPDPLPPGTARATGYHARYVRLGAALGRFTSFDPLGPGLAAGDGAPGGMTDHDHAAGKPSRREQEIAAWLDRDVPEELLAVQFDIATLLAAIEELRESQRRATLNMLEAEHRAYQAENKGALGRLAARHTLLVMAATALDRENALLRAAAASREHESQPGPQAGESSHPAAGQAS